MLSLSTCWFGPRQTSGEAMVAEALEMGFGAFELGYGLRPDVVPAILGRVRAGAFAITSVHAFTPAAGGEGGHPERFMPCGPGEEARALAVEKVLEHLAFAGRAGAPVVVLHAGRVAGAARRWPWVHGRIMDDRADGFFFRRRLRQMEEARARGAAACMDALRRSLDELLPAFEREGVRLALENLPSYDALPSPGEMDALASAFGSSPAFAFWFDLGHGQVVENAGYGDAAALAKRHLDLLAGVHVHDVIGPGGDHQAPGLGGVDFRRFAFLQSRRLVVEPSPAVSKGDLKGSVDFLRRVWPAL